MEQEKSLEEKTSEVKNLAELDKIEQEINANAKGETKPDKGDDEPGKEPEKQKNDDKDKKPDNKGEQDKQTGKSEKAVITDELRQKLNIPEKFKYMEDVVAWGAESEKLITKAANEKKEVLKEKEQAESEREAYKQEIAKLKEELKKSNEKELTISKDEKQKMIDEFNELFVEDPIKAITKVMQKVDEIKRQKQMPETTEPPKNDDKEKKEQEELEKVKKEFHERATKEWEDISKDLSNDEKKELLAELNKLSQEKPYILSLYDLKDIYDARKQKQEQKLKQEEEKKKKARSSQNSPESSADVIREDKIKMINEVKNLDDLDEAEKRI